MAEAIAVVGLVVPAIELVQKIVVQLKEFTSPKNTGYFRAAGERLPLLLETLQRIDTRARKKPVSPESGKHLKKLINGLCDDLNSLSQFLNDVKALKSASRLQRFRAGFQNRATEVKFQRLVQTINEGINVLNLYETNEIGEVSERLLQHVLQSNLHTGSVPAPEDGYGLCLGRAPLLESDAFIGRNTELRELHELLAPNSKPKKQTIVSIVGMGGLGKTQLSLEYVRRYEKHYSSIFWLNAKDELSIRRSMLDVAQILFSKGSNGGYGVDIEDVRIEQVRTWLSMMMNDQWLLLLDNYDNPNLPGIESTSGYDVRNYFPFRTQGHILITSRSPRLTFSKQMPLKRVEDWNTSLAVLSQRAGRDLKNDSDAEPLAKRLDGLLLALATAGASIGRNNITCAEYRHLYESAWPRVCGTNSEKLSEYEGRTMSSTWMVAVEQIKCQHPDIVELFKFCAFFDNQDIYFELLQPGTYQAPSWFSSVTETKLEFGQAMAKLYDHSLVEKTFSSYSVHGCIHDWIIEDLVDFENTTPFLLALCCIISSLQKNPGRASKRLLRHIEWLRSKRFQSFWERCTLNAVVLDASLAFARLYHWTRNDTEAQIIYQRLLFEQDALHGKTTTSSLHIVHELVKVYLDLDHLAKAESLITRLSEGVASLNDLSRLDKLMFAHTLACVRLKQGRSEEAAIAFLGARDQCLALLGSNHQMYFAISCNLGVTYEIMGKLEEGRLLFEELFAKIQANDQCDPYSKLLLLQDFGSLLMLQEDNIKQAEEILKSAHSWSEEAFGPDSHQSLLCVSNTAMLLQRRGDFIAAETLWRRVLSVCERHHGLYDTITSSTEANIGMSLFGQGRIEEAISINLKILSQQHAFAFSKYNHAGEMFAMNNLGVIYTQQGEFDKAEEMLKSAILGCKELLGPDHYRKSMYEYNLGYLYYQQGKLDEAEQIMRTSLAEYAHTIRPTHHRVQRMVSCLGHLYTDQQQFRKAEEMFTKLLRRDESTFGPHCSLTIAARAQLGIFYHSTKQLELAKDSLEHVLKSCEMKFGPAHEKTYLAVKQLKAVYEDRHDLDSMKAMEDRMVEIVELARKAGEQWVDTDMSQSTCKLSDLESPWRTIDGWRYGLPRQHHFSLGWDDAHNETTTMRV